MIFAEQGSEDDSSNQSGQSEYQQIPHGKQSSSNNADSNQAEAYQPGLGGSQEERNGKSEEQSNGLNEFSSGSRDLENKAPSDFSSSPGDGSSFMRPVSTTIFHVPQSTHYATQSFRFPNFRPQQVYVHDFTKGGGGVTSVFEQQQQLQEERNVVGEQSQNVQSWRVFHNQPQKAPKLIDNYPVENDSEEEKQFLSPRPKHPEIASGPVTTAECSTAETEPLTLTTPTDSTEKPLSTSATTQRDKIRLRVGKRLKLKASKQYTRR
jgi:hypothetical protein